MPINVNYKNPFIAMLKNYIQHYNHQRYWRYRKYVQESVGGGEFSLYISCQKLECDFRIREDFSACVR